MSGITMEIPTLLACEKQVKRVATKKTTHCTAHPGSYLNKDPLHLGFRPAVIMKSNGRITEPWLPGEILVLIPSPIWPN